MPMLGRSATSTSHTAHPITRLAAGLLALSGAGARQLQETGVAADSLSASLGIPRPAPPALPAGTPPPPVATAPRALPPAPTKASAPPPSVPGILDPNASVVYPPTSIWHAPPPFVPAGAPPPIAMSPADAPAAGAPFGMGFVTPNTPVPGLGFASKSSGQDTSDASHADGTTPVRGLGLVDPQLTLAHPDVVNGSGTIYGPLPDGFRVFSGPSVADDIRQGPLGDCYLLASVAAVMLAGQPVPLEASDLHYQAMFYTGGIADPILVDEQVPLDAGKWAVDHAQYAPDDTKKAWPALLMKAFARRIDIYTDLRQNATLAGWDDVNGGGTPTIPLSALTGAPTRVYQFATTPTAQLRAAALDNNYAHVVGTRNASHFRELPGFDTKTNSTVINGVTARLFNDDDYLALSGPKFGAFPLAVVLGHGYALWATDETFVLFNPHHHNYLWNLNLQPDPFYPDASSLGFSMETLQIFAGQLYASRARV